MTQTIAREVLLAEIDRLAAEAKALIPQASSLEEKQKLLDASLYLNRSLNFIMRVKDKLGERYGHRIRSQLSAHGAQNWS